MAKENNSSHLKEIQKTMHRSQLQIFISVLLPEVYSHLNQQTVRHLGLIFNLINFTLVTSQQG